MLLPSVPGDVFTTADALRYGVTQRQLEWAVRTSKLHRLRRGVLCSAEVWAAASPEGRLVLRARAVALGPCDARLVFSHRTAAALHGLPIGNVQNDAVWVTVPPGGRTGREYGIVRQAAPLADDEITVVQGLVATTPARTVADCLRHLDAVVSVPIGDAALRRRLLTPGEVEAAVARRRWPRAASASALLPLLDGLRESPVESRSAVVMHRYGVPRPAVQLRVLDERGRFVGRPDFVWVEQGVVGEADGLGKYDGDAGTVVADERARQGGSRPWGCSSCGGPSSSSTAIRHCSCSNSGPRSLPGARARSVAASPDGTSRRGRLGRLALPARARVARPTDTLKGLPILISRATVQKPGKAPGR